MADAKITKTKTKAKTKAKKAKVSFEGIVHIAASFNNTKVTITDVAGNVITWATAGSLGFKGSRKSSPYAAQITVEDAGRKASEMGVRTVDVKIKGPGSGRDSALKALYSTGLVVHSISDMTAIPHNGCRPRKRRRV